MKRPALIACTANSTVASAASFTSTPAKVAYAVTTTGKYDITAFGAQDASE